MAVFEPQMPKLGHFLRYLLEILYIYTPNRALSVSHIGISVLEKFKFTLKFLENNVFVDYFSKFSELSKF